MKVIFVDADGCMIDDGWADKCFAENGYDPYNYDEFNPRSLRLLARLKEETEAEVVFSSSWRLDELSFINAKEQFKEVGIQLYGYTTLDWHTGQTRGDEIALYLAQHPEVNNYVILDDVEINNALLRPHWVKTTFKEGFTYDMYSRAKEILLNKKETIY